MTKHINTEHNVTISREWLVCVLILVHGPLLQLYCRLSLLMIVLYILDLLDLFMHNIYMILFVLSHAN